MLSDLEVEKLPQAGKLYYLQYPIKNSDRRITVATTRPETMLGDTAVAVNPNDERYRELVVGQPFCCHSLTARFRSLLMNTSIRSLAPVRSRSRLLTIQTTTRWVCVTTCLR